MENVNSCCYIARIDEIKEIPGADNIEQGVYFETYEEAESACLDKLIELVGKAK